MKEAWLLAAMLLVAGCSTLALETGSEETVLVKVNNDSAELPLVDGVAEGDVGGAHVQFINYSELPPTHVETAGPVTERAEGGLQLVLPLRNVGDVTAHLAWATLTIDGGDPQPSLEALGVQIPQGEVAEVVFEDWYGPDPWRDIRYVLRAEFDNAGTIEIEHVRYASLRLAKILDVHFGDERLVWVDVLIENSKDLPDHAPTVLIGLSPNASDAQIFEPEDAEVPTWQAHTVRYYSLSTLSLKNTTPTVRLWLQGNGDETPLLLLTPPPALPAIDSVDVTVGRHELTDSTWQEFRITWHDTSPTPFVLGEISMELNGEPLRIQLDEQMKDGSTTTWIGGFWKDIEPGTWSLRTTLIDPEGNAIAEDERVVTIPADEDI